MRFVNDAINEGFGYNPRCLKHRLAHNTHVEVLEIVEIRNTCGLFIFCSQFGAGVWAKKLGGDTIVESIVDLQDVVSIRPLKLKCLISIIDQSSIWRS